MVECNEEHFEKAVTKMIELGNINPESFIKYQGVLMEEFRLFKHSLENADYQTICDLTAPNHSKFMRFLFCVVFGVNRFQRDSLRLSNVKRIMAFEIARGNLPALNKQKEST